MTIYIRNWMKHQNCFEHERFIYHSIFTFDHIKRRRRTRCWSQFRAETEYEWKINWLTWHKILPKKKWILRKNGRLPYSINNYGHRGEMSSGWVKIIKLSELSHPFLIFHDWRKRQCLLISRILLWIGVFSYHHVHMLPQPSFSMVMWSLLWSFT